MYETLNENLHLRIVVIIAHNYSTFETFIHSLSTSILVFNSFNNIFKQIDFFPTRKPLGRKETVLFLTRLLFAYHMFFHCHVNDI